MNTCMIWIVMRGSIQTQEAFEPIIEDSSFIHTYMHLCFILTYMHAF